MSGVQAYSMWEIGLIGMTITGSDGTAFVDLTRQEADILIMQLRGACQNFDELEALCKEHDEYVEYCEHMRNNAPGSCARCEGT